MECMYSLGGSIEVFAQLDKVLLVDVLDRDLVVEGVHVGVLVMAWISFSLVSWTSLLRVAGSVKSSAEEVRRR